MALVNNVTFFLFTYKEYVYEHMWTLCVAYNPTKYINKYTTEASVFPPEVISKVA